MKNTTRRFITNAFALTLAANGATAFAQNNPQDKPQEKKIERQIWVDTAAQTFDLRVPAPGQIGDGTAPRVMRFTGAGTPQDGFSYSFVASEVGTSGKVVKGMPYSAEVVNEFVQTLANGNRIVRRNSSNVARDGQGRTRREQSLMQIVPDILPDAMPGKTTIITDSVEGVTYILDEKNKTARRMRMGGAGGNVSFSSSTIERTGERGNVMVMTTDTTVAHGSEPLKKINVSGGVLQGSAVSRIQPAYPADAKAARVSGSVRVNVTVNEVGEVASAEAVSGHPMLRDAAVTAARQWKFKPTEISGQAVKVNGTLAFNFTLADDGNSASSVPSMPMVSETVPAVPLNRVMLHHANAKTTQLDKQTIEGIECEGTRIVETIPAGQVGNEQPIEIVIERWFSPELQLTVLTKHSDPRMGETTVRMTNLLRSEPDQYLFKVPSDYTIKDGGGPQTFMRTTKPE